MALCAQVEGTRADVFAVSPIALQSRCKRMPNEPIPTYGHSWPSPPECSSEIGDRQSEKKRWNCDGRAICNATHSIDAGHGVRRHRGVSDGSDRARPLWWSHSARTELFFADVWTWKVFVLIISGDMIFHYWLLKLSICQKVGQLLKCDRIHMWYNLYLTMHMLNIQFNDYWIIWLFKSFS